MWDKMLLKLCLWIIAFLPVILKAGQSSIIIVKDVNIHCYPCYRKILPGKKIVKTHIRRAMECNTIEECHRECNSEDTFNCEGFSYRRMRTGPRGMCELTSMPYSQMDIHRDFISDSLYDYYERKLECGESGYDFNDRPDGWRDLPQRPDNVPRPLTPQRMPYYPNRIPERPGSDLRHLFPNRGLNDNDQRPLSEIPRPINFGFRPGDTHITEQDKRPPQDFFRPFLYDRNPTHHLRPDYISSNDAYNLEHYPPDLLDKKPSRLGADQFSYRGSYPPRPIESIHSRPIDNNMHINDVGPRRHYYPKLTGERPDFGNRPYQDLGISEIAPHNSRPPFWEGYGSVYGGSYGYDMNYVSHPSKYDSNYPKHHKHEYPLEKEHLHENFYNYGSAFGYGDNYILPENNVINGGLGQVQKCCVRAGAGFKVIKTLVRKSYLTPNLDQCESLCYSEKDFPCLTFSYRYNTAPTAPIDNCLLSDVSYQNLHFYTDLEPDRDYDIYAMIRNTKTCGAVRPKSNRPLEECFWRVRSGFGLSENVIRKSALVANLGECEAQCVDAHNFTCRSFIFRYGQLVIDGLPNCFLSDCPTQEIDPLSFIDMRGAELYERGSFGRGCEPYPFPPMNFLKRRYDTEKKDNHKNEDCYLGYNKPCKLTPYAVLLAIPVNSESECRQKCSWIRERGPVPCMAFSYKTIGNERNNNCYLSDVPQRDLRHGLDYVFDDDYVMYVWKELEPQCPTSTNFGSLFHFDNSIYDFERRPPYAQLGNTNFEPHGHRPVDIDLLNSIQSDSRFSPGSRFGGYGNKVVGPPPGDNYQSDLLFNPNRPDPIRPTSDADRSSGSRPGNCCHDRVDYGGNHNIHHFEDRLDEPYPNRPTFSQHFTVNGYPCKRGTRCERNKLAGFWSCEIEDGGFSSWDYCCDPNHSCGFSRGFNYPWCYVGSAEDQWRPCSEQYSAYQPSPRPIKHFSDEYNDENHFNEIPHPGFFNRHWPIAYLHIEPPPNATSPFILTNDRLVRKINGTKIEKRAERSDNGRSNGNKDEKLSIQSSNNTKSNVSSSLDDKE